MRKFVGLVALGLIFGSAALGCAVEADEVASPVGRTSFALQINGGSIALAPGESVQVDAMPVDASGRLFRGLFTLSFSSTSPAVADVSPAGVVTGRAPGKATISVSAVRVDTGATADASVAVVVGGAASAPDASVGAPSPDAGTSSSPEAGSLPTASGPTSRTTLSSTTANIVNPERGFYGWSGSDFVNGFDAGSVSGAYNAGQRLVLAIVKLDAYRTSDLPASFLTSLGQRFASVRAAGMKTTLLFTYDFSSGGNDATASQIKRHLEQLAPVLSANADVIPYMRAGFIGAWGEWHSSKAGNACNGVNYGTSCATADANRLIVRDALLANVPATTQIQFRYPSDLVKWYPTPGQAPRVGMHNDCYLAGPSDSGTYQSQSQRDYAKALTTTAAFGGETCDGVETPTRTSCSDILSEGPQYHLAWLNVNYSPLFINAWKSGGCYDQVASFMGYRVQLDAVTAPVVAPVGTSATVSVELRNVGWSRLFSERKLRVILKSGATSLAATSVVDLRSLAAQATASTTVQIAVPIPAGTPSGDYQVSLALPDAFPSLAGDARFAVRFANADDAAKNQGWDATTASFRTGASIKVQ